MSGPGEYLPDPTEGITRPEDLPNVSTHLKTYKFEQSPLNSTLSSWLLANSATDQF
jgi:hypothetical protein